MDVAPGQGVGYHHLPPLLVVIRPESHNVAKVGPVVVLRLHGLWTEARKKDKRSELCGELEFQKSGKSHSFVLFALSAHKTRLCAESERDLGYYPIQLSSSAPDWFARAFSSRFRRKLADPNTPSPSLPAPPRPAESPTYRPSDGQLSAGSSAPADVRRCHHRNCDKDSSSSEKL